MGQPFGRISREPEPAGIAGFHLFGSVPEPLTLYRDIRALPAGCTRALVELHPSAPEVEMDPRVVAASQERPGQAHRVITHAAGDRVVVRYDQGYAADHS
jgi:asparagine synthase (glutamine-hydrolysing)